MFSGSSASAVVRHLRRWPILVVVVIVVVGGASAAWALSRSSGAGNGTSQLVAAKITTIKQTVSASGTIAAAHVADLDFAVSGRVTEIKVKAGDKVHDGDVLAVVDKTALKAEQAAAVATVTANEDKVAADAAGTTQYAADTAALTAAKAALHSANVALRNTTLRATITGTVTAVNLTVGQQIAPSGASSSDSSQVVVQSASTFIVDATVDDTEINQVKKGQPVAVTPDGASFPVRGTVTSVSTVPTSQSGVVSFPITVRLAGHPSGVYAGSSATLSITTKKVSNVLEIPTLAITFNGSTATVQVNNGGGAVARTITVGESYGLETQVLSGLKAGDKVVVKVPSFARVLPGGGSENGGISKSFGGEGGFGGGPPTGSFGSGPTFNSGPANSVGGN